MKIFELFKDGLKPQWSTMRGPTGEEGTVVPKWNIKSTLYLIPGLLITGLGIYVIAKTAWLRGGVSYESEEFLTQERIDIIKDATDDEIEYFKKR